MPASLIFLIGYRATGKSAVGRLLADKLGWTYTDADLFLEQRAGKSIERIFAEDGETTFRDLEAGVIDTLSRRENAVIATGGGVVQRDENRRRLRGGKVVWLTASVDIIWERMQSDLSAGRRRPNLAQGGLAEVTELLAQREPHYAACADWRVDTSSRSPEEVAQAIFDWLAQ